MQQRRMPQSHTGRNIAIFMGVIIFILVIVVSVLYFTNTWPFCSDISKKCKEDDDCCKENTKCTNKKCCGDLKYDCTKDTECCSALKCIGNKCTAGKKYTCGNNFDKTCKDDEELKSDSTTCSNEECTVSECCKSKSPPGSNCKAHKQIDDQFYGKCNYMTNFPDDNPDNCSAYYEEDSDGKKYNCTNNGKEGSNTLCNRIVDSEKPGENCCERKDTSCNVQYTPPPVPSTKKDKTWTCGTCPYSTGECPSSCDKEIIDGCSMHGNKYKCYCPENITENLCIN